MLFHGSYGKLWNSPGHIVTLWANHVVFLWRSPLDFIPRELRAAAPFLACGWKGYLDLTAFNRHVCQNVLLDNSCIETGQKAAICFVSVARSEYSKSLSVDIWLRQAFVKVHFSFLWRCRQHWARLNLEGTFIYLDRYRSIWFGNVSFGFLFRHFCPFDQLLNSIGWRSRDKSSDVGHTRIKDRLILLWLGGLHFARSGDPIRY